jgi:hypothetical protein
MMRLIPVNNSYSHHVTRPSTSFPVNLTFGLESVTEVCLYQNKDRGSKRKGPVVFSLLDEDYM